MRQETLFRGLVDCVLALGWVPWVLVFATRKTVTSGRDAAGQPVWTPALRQLAGECGFHPQACDPGAGNQQGSVASLVKSVTGHFLPGRPFADDPDLAEPTSAWCDHAKTRPADATGEPPAVRVGAAAVKGGRLPLTAWDCGLLERGQVAREALVAVAGNRDAVPVAPVGAPVTVRRHRDRGRIWRDAAGLADHPRAPDGTPPRVIDPAPFAPLVPAKPRAQAMLDREVLLGWGGRAPAFLGARSPRHRHRLREEMLAVSARSEQVGGEALVAALAEADEASPDSADALALLLTTGRPLAPAASPLRLVGVPPQREVDRSLSVDETWVEVDEALPAVVR